MPVVYDVVGVWKGEEPPGSDGGRIHSFGARYTRADAEAVLGDQEERYSQTAWEFWIEEVETEGLFEIPSRPTPRERFYGPRLTA